VNNYVMHGYRRETDYRKGLTGRGERGRIEKRGRKEA
jgi:hypothetical protein